MTPHEFITSNIAFGQMPFFVKTLRHLIFNLIIFFLVSQHLFWILNALLHRRALIKLLGQLLISWQGPIHNSKFSGKCFAIKLYKESSDILNSQNLNLLPF